MSFSRRSNDPRRRIYLRLASQIEGQLREAYARKHESGECTQSSIAEKLGINRSAVHRRLNGHTNMTTEVIADMVWALGQEIDVKIYDSAADNRGLNYEPEKKDLGTNPNRPQIEFEQVQ